MLNDSNPLVSCICITHNSVALLKRSIACFLNQIYPNKELVLVYPDDNHETIQYLEKLNNSLIKKIEIPTNTFTLGEKRNLGIKKSDGFYFCVWDDDDWYGNNRIAFHVQRLRDTQYKCSVLSRLLIYDTVKKEAYLSATRWAWEQTLLCEKSVTENPDLCYANLDRGEDSVMIFNLREKDLLLTISNPALYVYVYHGGNTWHRKHWEENIFQWATKLSIEQASAIEKILNGDYSSDKASRLLENII